MPQVTLFLEWEVTNLAGDMVERTTEVQRQEKTVDVMRISIVRAMLSRRFNQMLRSAPRDHIVTGSYRGQLSHDPFTMYSGGLSGVNGRIMRRDGEMEED
jgi:hypothetical protein